jgi:hypothetical protein
MGFLDWMFRSRKTGRITLAQLPNWQFAVWLLASAVMWLGHPWGTDQEHDPSHHERRSAARGTHWCDMRSHIASELEDGRVD